MSIKTEPVELELSRIGESYRRFRLVHPEAERRMVESIRRHGQLMPVVVSPLRDAHWELIDGFKRFRAARQLGLAGITAKILDASPRVEKACMIQLNRKAGFITDLEEAMVCESMYREDQLTQPEIATLLGRHKSWVSRRISLIERLCEEALSHIRLGLITSSIGREVARLPRGNQQKTLSAILKHRLCSWESQQLVSLLLESPRWEQDNILSRPREILNESRVFSGRQSKKLKDRASEIYKALCGLEKSLKRWLCEDPRFTPEECRYLLSAVKQVQAHLTDFQTRLE